MTADNVVDTDSEAPDQEMVADSSTDVDIDCDRDNDTDVDMLPDTETVVDVDDVLVVTDLLGVGEAATACCAATTAQSLGLLRGVPPTLKNRPVADTAVAFETFKQLLVK